MTKNNTSSKLQKHKTFKSNYLNSRGLDIKKSYSSFWMNDTRFGPSTIGTPATGDLGKLIKLNSYRRAITNFVKIVTKQDIPVNWSQGQDSFTDGKAITISTDIKDATFDVTVGLALHEASHVILTDFQLAKSDEFKDCMYDIIAKCPYAFSIGSSEVRGHLFAYLNWVEDRRIDHYVFSTSPGYKAYYHKLYDYYWNNAFIEGGFKSKKLQDPRNKTHWDFHIINSISNNANPKALPRLDEIMDIIDLPNIARLHSTQDSLKVAAAILTIVYEEMEAAKSTAKPKSSPKAPPAQDNSDSSDNSESDSDSDDSSTNAPEAQDSDSESESNSGDGGDGGDGGESDSDDEAEDTLTNTEVNKILDHLDKQKKFLNGSISKKSALKGLQKQLQFAAASGVDVQIVGDDQCGIHKCYIYDYTVGTKISELANLQQEITKDGGGYRNTAAVNNLALEGNLSYFSPSHAVDKDKAIELGLNMGSLLGKKLQLHNESRERVDNRLYTGKIDGKRIAHAGYDIESVFKQVQVDKCKNANIHISLDASGSMGGENWLSTIQTTMAIAKAAKYTQGITIQVSLRTTTDGPKGYIATVVLAYDSIKNPISHLVTVMRQLELNSTTPEGLCFDGLLKKGMFKRGTDTMDSYFLNISDGQPSMAGYGGQKAVVHTRNTISKMKSELNMKVLAFWIETTGAYTTLEQMRDRFNQPHGSGAIFRQMYGSDATVVDPKSAMSIAQQLNKRFLKHA